MSRAPVTGTLHHRTIFLSDVHLGTPSCKAAELLNFLQHNEAETLYLVGDIIDGIALRRSLYWNDDQTELVRTLIRRANAGTRVIYVPGNHDEGMRDFVGTSMMGIEIELEAVHVTAQGKRLLIIHGDQFDGPVRYGRFTRWLGSFSHHVSLRANDFVAWLVRQWGGEYWSFSGFLKRNVAKAAEFIDRYERWAAREAQTRGFDGVVCGHIHMPHIRQLEAATYYNDGDWVEHCTALVEDRTGTLRLVRWARPGTVLPFTHPSETPDPE